LINAVAQGTCTPRLPELIDLRIAAQTSLDPAGLRCLLPCLAAAQDSESRLILANPSPQVTRISEITGLLELFGLSPQPSVEPCRTTPAKFLQLFSFVALTAYLFHRNSAERADGDDETKAMVQELLARTRAE
jgi:hypothetical protein